VSDKLGIFKDDDSTFLPPVLARLQNFKEFQSGYTLIDDMVLANEQFELLYRGNSKTDMTKAVKKWPSSTIPYLLDDHFSMNSKCIAAKSFLTKFFN
jgi:hypothetical protein